MPPKKKVKKTIKQIEWKKKNWFPHDILKIYFLIRCWLPSQLKDVATNIMDFLCYRNQERLLQEIVRYGTFRFYAESYAFQAIIQCDYGHKEGKHCSSVQKTLFDTINQILYEKREQKMTIWNTTRAYYSFAVSRFLLRLFDSMPFSMREDIETKAGKWRRGGWRKPLVDDELFVEFPYGSENWIISHNGHQFFQDLQSEIISFYQDVVKN